MSKVNKKIEKLLHNPSKQASEKFWEIEKLIYSERKKPGVLVEMKRSSMLTNILMLIKTKVITFEDLSDFTEDLQNDVKKIIEDE